MPGRASGRWRIVGESIEPLSPEGPAEVLVPGEEVLLLAVDLPLPTRRQRIAALPFATEEQIAEPVDRVHLALGEAVGPRRYLVGVVAHEAMARWVALAEAAGLGGAALVPEPLTLAVPAEGEWAVAGEDGRSLVRCPDGAGFVVPTDMLEAVRAAAGEPAVVTGVTAATPALDLRQGRYAVARGTSPLRRIAFVAAAGIAAHALIATADTIALRRIADRWRGETAAAVVTLSPGTGTGGDLTTTAAALLPADASGQPSRFLPLLTRAAPVLGGSALTTRGIEYRTGTLVLTVEGAEPAIAQAAASLAAAGLSARRAPGVITVSER